MRYFIHLCYKGTDFHGWQKQKNAPYTVQSELERAFSIFLKEQIEIIGCGRTDTGVHAHSYYAHFDTNQKLGHQDLYGLNAILANDVSILEIFSSANHAHARFSAVKRTYKYFIHYYKNPFLNGRSFYLRQSLKPELRLMNDFCEQLKSVRDFTSFEKKGGDNTHSLCEVSEALWTETADGCMFEISSNRFLRNMVRAIVGTSLMIGCQKREIPDILEEVHQKKAIHLSITAPANGLYLWSIDYPQNTFTRL